MINDPAAILIGAVDPDTGVIHFYDEYYERDKVLAQVADAFKRIINPIRQGVLHMPLIDPSSNKRSKTTGKSYKQQLQTQHGIVTKEANNNIEDGIQRVKNLMYYGKIRFFNSLKQTLREGCEYRYPTLEERNKNKNLGDKPLDKDNHLMDCLRYICQELPYDYLDMNRVTFNNYMKFFEEQDKGLVNKKPALSFDQLIDIINTEYKEESFIMNKQDYVGGYKIC